MDTSESEDNQEEFCDNIHKNAVDPNEKCLSFKDLVNI